MKKLTTIFFTIAIMLLTIGTSFAHHMEGNVYCDANRNDIIDEGDWLLEGVCVNVVSTDAGKVNSTDCTDIDGYYYIGLPSIRPASYDATIVSGLPEDAVFVDPSTNRHSFVIKDDHINEVFDWLIDAPICHEEEGECWFTAGGVKFEPIVDIDMAQHTSSNGKGPKDSVGGVAYPSCSPFPSNGGQWNHVAHSLKLHLIGKDITVIRCGNVDGIEPGSESPVCPYNFIEFEGIGIVKGIHGNHIEDIDVTFYVRAEDHNEPGNEKAVNSNDGEDIDRYFLRVVDGDGNLLILVDEDGVDDGEVDPLTITGGNFQMHCTSCD